jgi:chromate reductase, NAD(P)H dehydrogenase (quinone)
MVKLLGISGSLRKGSFNTALLRAARRVAGSGIAIEIATLDGVPLYNGDDETTTGIPAAVQTLKARVIAADGVLVATPEYNSGVPGVLKNGLDWLSRPHTDIPKVFAGRPFAVFGATPSGYGTALSQNAWLSSFKHLGVDLFSGGRVTVSKVHELLDDKGEISDAATLKVVADFVQGFARSIEKRREG